MSYSLIRPSYYISQFEELWSFLKSPAPDKNEMMSTREKVSSMIVLYIMKMALVIIAAILMAAISPWFDPENISKSNMSTRFSPVMLLLVGGFILPSVEEVGFRLSLRFKPVYLALSAAVFGYYLLTRVVFKTSNSMVDESFAIRASGAMLCGLTVYLLLLSPLIRRYVSSFWEKRFSVIFYSFCIAFAGIHIFNYELTLVNLLFLPLITLPQLLSAIIYGYTRVAYGFQYPLLLHCANNLLAISISLLPFEDLLV